VSRANALRAKGYTRRSEEVIQETSPDMGTTVYVRDARGLVTQQTDGRGVVTDMTYDNAGRMLTKSFPAASAENVTYTYDSIAGGNKGVGRLTSASPDRRDCPDSRPWPRARHLNPTNSGQQIPALADSCYVSRLTFSRVPYFCVSHE
jgi:YD repeat-containing protein